MNKKLKMVCPNILSLVDLVPTIPASSADAERGFSRLKYTKTDARSRILDTNLSDQLCVMLESSEVKTFDPSPVIDLWNSTPRRPDSALDIYESSLSTSARLPGSPSKVQSAEPITPKKSDHVQVLNCRNSAETIVSVDEELVEVLHVGDDKQEKKDANNNVEEIMSVSSDLNTVSSQAIMPLSVANDLSSSQVFVISNLSSSQLSTPVSVSSGNALVICNHGPPHPLRGGRSLAVFLLFDCPCSAG